MNDFLKPSVRYILGSAVRFRSTSVRLAAGALLLAVLLASAPAAHAQIIFDVQLSERGKRIVTDPDRMNAEMLLGLLAKEGRHSYKGEETVMAAKDLVFIVGEHGKRHQRIDGKPFELEPGTHPMGRRIPGDSFLALFEKAFPDGYFFPDTIFFPDGYFNPGKQFPDTLFDEMDLKDDQVGLVLALVPADEKLREKVQSRPMGLVLSPAR